MKLQHLLLRIKLFGWLGIIIYGCLSPATALPKVPLFIVPHFDKIVHFILFLGLGLLLIRYFYEIYRMKTHHAIILGFSITLIVAIATEVLQNILPIHRDSDFLDFLADFGGIATAIVVFRFLNSYKWFKILV